MTYQELKDEVTFITGDYVVDTIALLRKAENDFIEQTKCTEYVEDVTILLADIADVYDLDSELTYPFVELHRIEWEGIPLYPLTRKATVQIYDDDDAPETGTPEAYMIEGHNLRLIPEPTTGGTIRIWYSYRNSVTDGSSPIIPVNDHKTLPDYVIAKVFESTGQENRALYYSSRYEKRVNEARLKYSKQRHKQRYITDTTGRPGPILILNHEGEDGWAPS